MGGLTAQKRPRITLELHHLPGKVIIDDDLQCERWYEGAPQWPNAASDASDGPRATLAQWTEIAGTALSSASRMYEKKFNSSAGEAMKSALGKEKTVGDKIASVTLLVQESPLHRLDELRTLLSFAEKKGRRERGPAIDALKDLFVNDLLPDERRLLSFSDRDFSCARGSLSKRHLSYALYESELKTVYREFLHILEESGKDTLPFFKERIVKVISELLIAKPENEKLLLAMLVNKLGDPDRKVSSTASHCMRELIEKHHPQMKLIVVKEIEQLLIRQNVTRRSQYYSVVFLNQIRFDYGDTELARKFVRIYLDLFTTCLIEEKKTASLPKDKTRKAKLKRVRKKKKATKEIVERKNDDSSEAKDSRLMGALLLGVNRAFPYTKPQEDDTTYQPYYDSLYQVAHAKSFTPATNALAFLFQMSQSNTTQSDRFYRALYSRIYDATDAGEAKQGAFLNLVYKAMKGDTNTKRTKAFIKRLFQAGLFGSSGFAGACIILVSEVCSDQRHGLLKAFVHLSEYDDEDEHFDDVNSASLELQGQTALARAASENGASADLLEPSDLSERAPDKGEKGGARALGVEKHSNSTEYDPHKRDPQFAGAERSSLWEAVSLCSHYHPSISKFGSGICKQLSSIEYGGDPLSDFTEISFLDKFSYKKAKNRVVDSLHGKRSARYRDDPVVNSRQFQELIREGGVADDDVFFARFFRCNPDRIANDEEADLDQNFSTRDRNDSDEDSEEEAIERAMREEMHRLGADEGFSSQAIKNHVGDIDEECEYEMRAFEKAFENKMVKYGDEDDGLDDDVMPLGSVSDSDDDNEDRKRKSDSTAPKSAFMPAEDFAAAINEASLREGNASLSDPTIDANAAMPGRGGKEDAKRTDIDSLINESLLDVPSKLSGPKKRKKQISSGRPRKKRSTKN